MDLKGRIKNAERIAVLTGAGISAESGIPTFRGADGLWKQFRAEELATPQAFQRDPKLVWEWYDWRRQKCAQAVPNPGHLALAELERIAPHFTLITQNVDGLHALAGSKHILELHGNIWRMRCVACEAMRESREPLGGELPHCDCGALMRPDIVWFGEALPQQVLSEAFSCARSAEVFLSVGTSAWVMPACQLPVVAKQSGAYVVEVNLEKTPISEMVDEAHHRKAGEILPSLLGVEI